MSNTTLPPLPMQTPFLGANNRITQPWVIWFNQLYYQSGGGSSTSLASLIESVESLTSTVNGQTSAIAALELEVDGLQQGRNP